MNKPSTIVLAGGGILVALLLGAVLFVSGGGASATKSESGILAAPARVSTVEANAWAEARAANTDGAYRTYLAAYPGGAFSADANQSIGRLAAEADAQKAREAAAAAEAAESKKARAATRVSENRGPSRAQIREACGQYVNSVLSPPSKTGRLVGGAAAGCAVGALAGGNDTRNCAVGAVAGGATGYVTGANREKKREQMYQSCVANGGPPR